MRLWSDAVFGYAARQSMETEGTPMSDTHGTVFWSELMTPDVEAAKAYYGQICGWTFMTMPMPDGSDYHLAMLGETPMAGIIATQDGESPDWMSYFAVDDLDAAVAATAAAGGSVERAPFTVPGTGRIALLTDPTGARLGLMTPEPMED